MRAISRSPTDSIPTVAERKSLSSGAGYMAALATALALPSAHAAATIEARRPAEVRSLNAELLSRASATETLTRWCADHHLAADPAIVAVRMPDLHKAPDAATLALLGGVSADRVQYRRVDLKCGSHILSEAENWYRPDTLTPAMNAALENTQTPFGIVVRPLAFTRRTIEVTVPRGRRPTEPFVLRHRALLTTDAGSPFSVVEESYTREVLADIVN